jgi:fucose 4-O-acetylase-like acetyltransferase
MSTLRRSRCHEPHEVLAVNDRRRWLTPKSDSLESFVFFLLRALTVLALVSVAVYLAVADEGRAATATALLAAAAAFARRP